MIDSKVDFLSFYESLALNPVGLELDPLQFDDAAEKTEEPTEKRKQEARDKGQVPQSKDLTTAFVLVIATIILYNLLHQFYATVADMFRKSIALFEVQNMTPDDFWTHLVNMIAYWFAIMVPVFFVVIVLTLIVQIWQVGFQFSTESLVPDLSRFNPVSGFKRIFGAQAAAELVKSLIKLVILGYFPYKMFVNEYPAITRLFSFSLGDALDYVSWVMVKLIIEVGIVMIIYGIFDFLYQEYKMNKDLRMSKQEVKEERKQSEGDPQIKSKIRQKQRELAQRQMMGEVPKADVVVTNPTHFAIALKYDRNESGSAPKVVAKGKGEVAKKIREIATEYDVPLVENKVLARALFRNVELGFEVPEELYKAVAEVYAYVTKLKRKSSKAFS